MGEVIRLNDYRKEEPIDFFTALEQGGVFGNFSDVSDKSQQGIYNTLNTQRLSPSSSIYQSYISLLKSIFGELFMKQGKVDHCTNEQICFKVGSTYYYVEGLNESEELKEKTIDVIHKYFQTIRKTNQSIFDIHIISINSEEKYIEIVFANNEQVKLSLLN